MTSLNHDFVFCNPNISVVSNSFDISLITKLTNLNCFAANICSEPIRYGQDVFLIQVLDGTGARNRQGLTPLENLPVNHAFPASTMGMHHPRSPQLDRSKTRWRAHLWMRATVDVSFTNDHSRQIWLLVYRFLKENIGDASFIFGCS